jgi:HK97 family phage major capsid protein
MGKQMTLDELREMIKSIVAEAVEPLKQQQTDWASKIFAVPPAEDKKPEKGMITARIVRALAAAKGDPERAATWAKKNWNDSELVVKALAAGDATAGGYLVPPEYSTDLIELLKPQAVVRRLGAVTLPMDAGTMSIPKITGGATASYIGENTNIPKTEQTFGQITLTWKKLAALVPISNDLLRFSNPNADSIVRDDLVSAMALREDLAFIRDDGTSNKPKGLLNWAPTENKFSANPTVNLANVTADLGKAVYLLKKNNVRFIRPGWIMSPRTENYLMTVRDANGNFAFRTEMLAGRLFGFPYGVTSQIPENLGVDGNESEVYLVDFADAVIGEATQLIIDASTEAAYHDGTNVVAAFSLDQTVIRVIAQHDFAMRHAESIAVIQAVKWGAA